MAGLVKDKATAFINEIGGQVTNKILCKASSHDVAGPKKKHVDYLIQVTNDSQSSITELADLIFERSRHANWTVVMKLLITSHSLMTLGNERFLQCLATRSSTFSLDEFWDGTDSLATSMSVYVPRYARYLSCMCTAYRTLAMDVGRLPRGDSEAIRTMDSAKLLKTAGVIQQQIDHLLEIDIPPLELTNGVICTVYLMVYKDVLNLYAAYNEVMINLLERFFDMKKQQCKEVVDAYRKFITRQESVGKFLAQAESVNVDRNPIPDFKKPPEGLLPALETHLNDLDLVKKSGSGEASPSIAAATEKLKVLNATDDMSSSSGQSASVTPSSYLMEAQRRRFEELKSRAAAANASGGSGTPKLSSQSPAMVSDANKPQPQTQPAGLGDLLDLQVHTAPMQQQQQAPPPSTNPWGNSSATSTSAFNPFEPSGKAGNGVGVVSTDPWSSTISSQGNPAAAADPFSDIRGPDFDSVFGKSQISAPPPPSAAAPLVASITTSIPFSHGDVLQPTSVNPLGSQQPSSSTKLQQKPVSDGTNALSGLLDNLNLDIKPGAGKKTDHQWKPAAPSVMTGGPKWQESQPQPLQSLGGPKGPQQPTLAYQQPSTFMMSQPSMMMQPAGYTQQPTMAPTFAQPGYTGYTPSQFTSPGLAQTGFAQPVAGFQQPGFQQPGFQQHGFQQPGFQQPGFQQHGFQQPGFQQPGFQQPGYAAGFQQPGLAQPGMMQPAAVQKPSGAMNMPLWSQPTYNTQNNSLL